jgi:hypothetical protein
MPTALTSSITNKLSFQLGNSYHIDSGSRRHKYTNLYKSGQVKKFYTTNSLPLSPIHAPDFSLQHSLSLLNLSSIVVAKLRPTTNWIPQLPYSLTYRLATVSKLTQLPRRLSLCNLSTNSTENSTPTNSPLLLHVSFSGRG